MSQVNELTFKRSNGYIYAKYSADDFPVEVSTGHKVTKESWDAKKLPAGTKNLMRSLSIQVTQFAESKLRAVQPILAADIDALLRSIMGKKPKIGTSTLTADLTEYKAMMESGKLLFKDVRPYSKSKINSVQTLISKLAELKLGGIKTAAFTDEDYNTLINKVNAKEQAKNSLNNYTSTLMAFFRDTAAKGWHSNRWWVDKKTSVGTDKVEGNVYLSEDEIQTLLNVETRSANERIVADIFCFGCAIGLRHGDLGRLQDSVFVGGIVHKMNKKTGATVQVPLKSSAKAIWEKYDFKFPEVERQTFYNIVHRLAERAGFDSPCHFVSTIAGVRTEQTFPKHEMISPHTMRRSFATNAYLAGVPVPAIMKMGGWRTQDSFFKYLCISNAENAELMKKHEFFK